MRHGADICAFTTYELIARVLWLLSGIIVSRARRSPPIVGGGSRATKQKKKKEREYQINAISAYIQQTTHGETTKRYSGYELSPKKQQCPSEAYQLQDVE